MKMLLNRCLCLIVLLSGLNQLVNSRHLPLDNCTINVHTQELRRYFSVVRSTVVSGDSEIEVKLLDKSLPKSIHDGQMCCFLRLVLRFYIERVFNNYASSQPQNQSCTSSLANAFVTIRKDIHKCHCTCTEETQRTIDSLHAEFIKLEISLAAQKAMGELDTVLDWLDELGHSTRK